MCSKKSKFEKSQVWQEELFLIQDVQQDDDRCPKPHWRFSFSSCQWPHKQLFKLFPKNSFLLNFFTETNWKLACPAHSSHFHLLLLLFPLENFQACQSWHPEGPLGAQLLPISSSTSQNTSSQRQLLVSQVYLLTCILTSLHYTYIHTCTL